jgi:hypothetical protein
MSESTGIESVDAVVESLGVLDDLPVAEHVTVFEHAHESLRAQMAAPVQQSSGAPIETSQA